MAQERDERKTELRLQIAEELGKDKPYFIWKSTQRGNRRYISTLFNMVEHLDHARLASIAPLIVEIMHTVFSEAPNNRFRRLQQNMVDFRFADQLKDPVSVEKPVFECTVSDDLLGVCFEYNSFPVEVWVAREES